MTQGFVHISNTCFITYQDAYFPKCQKQFLEFRLKLHFEVFVYFFSSARVRLLFVAEPSLHSLYS